MTGEQAADVRAIVVETLAEQQRIRHDDIDAVVLKAVATTLTSFGIDEEDRKELRADFQHLRRWRRSVEQALMPSHTAPSRNTTYELEFRCGDVSDSRGRRD